MATKKEPKRWERWKEVERAPEGVKIKERWRKLCPGDPYCHYYEGQRVFSIENLDPARGSLPRQAYQAMLLHALAEWLEEEESRHVGIQSAPSLFVPSPPAKSWW